jgi:hypothetical protein
MVKKIKVVEVQIVETPESVETSSSQMKLLSPTDETPAPPPTPEPIADEEPNIEEVEQPREVEKPKEAKPKKQDEKITCSICNKTMLMKTYRYTHQKLCKPNEPEIPKVVEAKPKVKKEAKPKEVTSPPTNLGQVSFSEYKETHKVIPDPLEIYRVAKEQRQQIRIQRVKSLISQAV